MSSKISFIHSKRWYSAIILLLTLLCIILAFKLTLNLQSAFAQTCPVKTGTNTSATGLITAAGLITNKGFGNPTGQCIQGTFAEFRSPYYDAYGTYNALYAQYYERKTTGRYNYNPGSGITQQGAYLYNGDLNITNQISGSATAVIFVNGNLTIGPLAGNELIYGTNSTGLVFVVKGKIDIHKSIQRIDAVLIAEGVGQQYAMCTTWDGSCPFNTQVIDFSGRQLLVNGSLIALNSQFLINFKRSTSDNAIPTEKVNYQAKYLAILNNTFTRDLIILNPEN
jgi:hypothetical protein